MKMSKKAQEKHADWLFGVSSNLFCALYVMLLVAPIGAIAAAAFDKKILSVKVKEFVEEFFSSELGRVFLVFEFSALVFSLLFLFVAMNKYSKLYPDS